MFTIRSLTCWSPSSVSAVVIFLVARLAGAMSGGRVCDVDDGAVGVDELVLCLFGWLVVRMSCLLVNVLGVQLDRDWPSQSSTRASANGCDDEFVTVGDVKSGSAKVTVRGCKLSVPRAFANGVGAVGGVGKDEFEVHEVGEE